MTKNYKRYHTHKEPPAFKYTATWKFFCKEHGIFPEGGLYPHNVNEYESYKYWCITNGFNAIAGAVQPVELALERAQLYFKRLARLEMDWLLDERSDDGRDEYTINSFAELDKLEQT